MLSLHLDLKIIFSFQYGKSLSIVRPSLVLKSNESLPKFGKTKSNSLVGTKVNSLFIRLKNVKQSAKSDHLLQCNYAINFDDFSILATVCNKFKLLLRESLLIKCDKPILNRTIKAFSLELFD